MQIHIEGAYETGKSLVAQGVLEDQGFIERLREFDNFFTQLRDSAEISKSKLRGVQLVSVLRDEPRNPGGAADYGD